MKLADIWQQVLSSNTSAIDQAEALLLEGAAYDLDRDEWRELIAGVPPDVRKEIGVLKTAGTQGHLVVSL